MDETNRIKDIVEGFEDDFNNIVVNFISLYPNLNFLDFLNYWNEESLDTLFANRFDPRELLESISNLNQILVKILVNPTNNDNKYSVIALYFLLAIHVKQPERFRRRIRLTCEDSIYIQNLIAKSVTTSYSEDINFVWNQLRTKDSIDLVEERFIYGPSMLVSSKSSARKNATASYSNDVHLEHYKDQIEFLESKIEPTLVSFESMLAPYEQLKDSMNLNKYNDQIESDQQTHTSVESHLDKAKLLLSQFKTT